MTPGQRIAPLLVIAAIASMAAAAKAPAGRAAGLLALACALFLAAVVLIDRRRPRT